MGQAVVEEFAGEGAKVIACDVLPLGVMTCPSEESGNNIMQAWWNPILNSLFFGKSNNIKYNLSS